MDTTPSFDQGQMEPMPEVPVMPPEPPKSKRTMWIIIGVVAVLLCCCCVIVAAVGMNWATIQNVMNGLGQ